MLEGRVEATVPPTTYVAFRQNAPDFRWSDSAELAAVYAARKNWAA